MRYSHYLPLHATSVPVDPPEHQFKSHQDAGARCIISGFVQFFDDTHHSCNIWLVHTLAMCNINQPICSDGHMRNCLWYYYSNTSWLLKSLTPPSTIPKVENNQMCSMICWSGGRSVGTKGRRTVELCWIELLPLIKPISFYTILVTYCPRLRL